MEDHLKERPPKKTFSKKTIDALRDKAIDKIKAQLLPDEEVLRIVLIGSSIKESFEEYRPPGFRGSLYSDFDFIVFVDNDYEIPDWLDREPDGKPFPDDDMNLAYRNKNFIDGKYDAEVFFIREANANDEEIQELGEQAGIPMTSASAHKHMVVYSR
ncbi:MAG: hypothetical protein ABIG66_01330 [Candidatus Kerfeldbacteria bacterium]